jgi:hypothetical protein
MLVGVGGGPRDVLTTPVEVACDGTDRQCADAGRVERLVANGVKALDSLLATPPTVSGSSPIGAAWTVLSTARPGDHVLIISDFVEHSDVFDLVDSVDLSTVDARAAVIDQIAAVGIDFSELDLENVVVRIELVPGEIGGVSTVRFEHMRLFVEELLGVMVTPLELTAVSE